MTSASAPAARTGPNCGQRCEPRNDPRSRRLRAEVGSVRHAFRALPDREGTANTGTRRSRRCPVWTGSRSGSLAFRATSRRQRRTERGADSRKRAAVPHADRGRAANGVERRPARRAHVRQPPVGRVHRHAVAARALDAWAGLVHEDDLPDRLLCGLGTNTRRSAGGVRSRVPPPGALKDGVYRWMLAVAVSLVDATGTSMEVGGHAYRHRRS